VIRDESTGRIFNVVWTEFLNIIIASEIKSLWKLKTRAWPFGGLVRLLNYLK
jgi:hypothetical protein